MALRGGHLRKRPRRLAWPRTPDFQSGTWLICRSRSVALAASLQDESPGSRRPFTLDESRVIVNRDEDDRRLRVPLDDLRGRLDAVAARHHGVADDDVEWHGWGRGDVRCPVTDPRDQLE